MGIVQIPVQVDGRQGAADAGFWRALVVQSPVAVAVIGRDGRFVYANPAAVALYGTVDAAGLVGRPAITFVSPGDHRLILGLFEHVLRGEAVLGRRWRLLRDDGRPLDVEINAGCLALDDGPVVQVELREVTAQVAAEMALSASEERWRSVFDGSPVGIGLSDGRGHFVAANASLCSLLGRPESDLLGRSAAEFTHPGDLDDHARAGEMILAAGDGILRIEKRYLRPDGEIRWAWLTVTHIPGPAEETWTLAHVQDITARKAADQVAADSRTNLRAVGEVIRQIQAGSDARETIVHAGLQLGDASYVSLLEPTTDGSALQVTATTDVRLLDTTVPIDGRSATATVFASGQPLFFADPIGDSRVSQSLMALTGARSVYIVAVGADGTVGGVIIVAWDHRVPDLDDRRAEVITLLAHHAGVALRQATLVSELQSLALRDQLTSLPNRRGWEQGLTVALAGARRSGSPLTVALADLDAFKAYNDAHGHPAGDELLQAVAVAIKAAVRESDWVARWGGEEFAVVLPDCSGDESLLVLERLRQSMPSGQTCSIGFATWDGREEPPTLMGRVDDALYAAKRSGRNRVVQATTASRVRPASFPH